MAKDKATPAAGTRVRIAIGDAVITGHLHQNATAQDLLTLLPLTLTFRDLNNVEKIARLPRDLTMDGVPDGDDPDVGDIGYYGPSRDLALYYGDVGYWPGIVRIGASTAIRHGSHSSPTASRRPSSSIPELGGGPSQLRC